jgi:hypothetical protein
MKKLIDKITFLIRLWLMDDEWYYMGASSYQLFPPSFYCKYTKEQIERITAEKLEKIKIMIEELDT